MPTEDFISPLEQLGISQERASDIIDVVLEASDKCKSNHEAFMLATLQYDGSEAIFAAFAFGFFSAYQRHDPVHLLHRFLN